MKKILIAIGDSKYAEHATEYGFNLARLLNAEVGLVHIIEPIVGVPLAPVDAGLGFSTMDNTMDMVTVDLMHVQDEQTQHIIADTIKKYGADMQITNFSEYGDTAEGIISCSQEFNADMIVIGTHSRTGLDRFLMGSVAEHVVRHSMIPVLVVPMKDME